MSQEIQNRLYDTFEKVRIESQDKENREVYILKAFLENVNYKEEFNKFALKYSYCIAKLCKSSYGSRCPIFNDDHSCSKCCNEDYMYNHLLNKALENK